IEDIGFDAVGCFRYSREPGTRAGTMDEDPALHLELATSYLEMGMCDEAAEEARLAHENGGPPEAALVLARASILRGDPEAAVAAFQAYLAACDTGEEALEARYELALLHLERGESDAALPHLERIAEQDPDYRDVSTLLASASAD
ncbi:MAG: tetratricopeptide repeat protein, partial [Nitrospirae bacterium]